MSQVLSIDSSAVPSELECTITDAKWQALVALMSVEVPDGFKRTVSDTEPGPDDRDGSWFRLNADGTPDREYWYADGKWLAKHPDFEGKVVMWEGTEAAIDTLDGGVAEAVSATTGPFWEKVDELDARFPVGPGTMAGGTVVDVEDTGGEDEHTLTEAEMPSHTHQSTGNQFLRNTAGAVAASGSSYGSAVMTTDSAGSDEPHNNLPPYYGIFFIRRTARQFYVAP